MSSYEGAVFFGLVAAAYAVVLALRAWRPDLLKRNNVSLEGGAILLRTQRFNGLILRIASKARK